MDNKTVSEMAYSKIMHKLVTIERSLDNRPKKEWLANDWLDVQEVCGALKICKRTLQHYRKSGMINSSQIGGKIYFKVSDVQEVLERNYKRNKKQDEKGR